MNLKEYLKTNQMKLSIFAQKAGLKQPYASLIKNGHKRPSPDVALRIEEATGGVVSRMELLYPESQHGAADGVIPDHNVLYPKILFFCCISIAFVPEEERCEK